MKFRDYWLTWLSLALYAACLTQDGFCVSSSCWPGYGVLPIGALGALSFDSLADQAWWANPLLFIGWICIYRRTWRVAFVFGLVALAVAASFIFMDTVQVSASGIPSRIESLGPGYWLWLASMTAAAADAALRALGLSIGRS